MKELGPAFIVLVGLPGSGKSTFAQEFKTKFGYVVISSDDIRKESYNDVNAQEHNNEVFDEMLKRSIKCLQNNENVIYDATNVGSKKRIHLLNSIKRYTNNIICYFFATPYEMCIERNNKRERKVPEEVIKRMFYSFQVPSINEGFTNIQIIYPENMKFKDYNELVESFMNIEHDNPYHSETIGEHLKMAKNCLSSYRCTMCNEEELMLATLLHDIGKPETKFFDENGIAHYYNHENVGAYRIFELNVPEELKLNIALLINWHMKPYQWGMNLKKSKVPEFLGQTLSYELMLLHLCDEGSTISVIKEE